ncbi:single-stranded DNA-binding protein [Pseudonocardia sp. MCCB 268]|nr:single-stranded DNA-binding protein [Pseudonocardia cytotoxica]
MSVNQITITGNVTTRKPILRYSPNGYAVTDLFVAVNPPTRPQQQRVA